VTRFADLKSNHYHEGELQGSSTNLLLTGNKDFFLEPAVRGSAAQNFPQGMSAIAIADQPSSLAGDTLDNTSAIGRRWNTFDFRDAPSGSAWLTGVSADGGAGAGTAQTMYGCVNVIDILWWNGQNITTASNSSTINSPTWPARDRSGATSGEGVMIGIIAFANLSAVTNLTITYTNSGGTGSRTGTLVSGIPTGSSLGLVRTFELQDGDVGVQQVNALNRTTAISSANYCLFAYRLIAQMPFVNVVGGNNRSGLLTAPAKIYPGSVLCAAPITTTGLSTTYISWRARYSYSSL